MLDPTSFNPSIDIYATTNIAGEDIDVSMNGHFNNPILILESINDYSQSDIIELILKILPPYPIPQPVVETVNKILTPNNLQTFLAAFKF